MLTRRTLKLPTSFQTAIPDITTDDWKEAVKQLIAAQRAQKKEFYELFKALQAYTDGLNNKGVLQIAQATIADSTIDNTPVGGTTAAAGAFTTLSASGLISANGGQIKFPATRSASADANTLDDYEENTWTPALTFTTPGDLSVAYSVQTGDYTAIGRMVFATFSLVTSTFTHTTASGELRVTGLPFASANSSNRFWAVPLTQWQGITKAGYTDVAGRLLANSSQLNFQASASGAASSAVAAADMPTTGVVILIGMAAYFV